MIVSVSVEILQTSFSAVRCLLFIVVCCCCRMRVGMLQVFRRASRFVLRRRSVFSWEEEM